MKDRNGQQRDRIRRDAGGTKPEFQNMPEHLWRARVIPTNDFEFCSAAEGVTVERGDFVILTTRYGIDMARILGPVTDHSLVELEELRMIHRVAGEDDLARREELRAREDEAFRICRTKIDGLGLSMKLVSAHFVFEDQKIMFYFTAETRIDFRELVKELISHFRTRIELRQIGVRDESRVIGGMAVCGRQYCCHGITDSLSPVSIKMAKEQNLSLNSLKISGPCGRLLCCLAFEHEHYSAERKLMPHEGSRILHDGVNYKVAEVNIFTHRISLVASEGRRLDVSSAQLSRKHGGGWEIVTEEQHQPESDS